MSRAPTGILLVNLGTPRAPTVQDVRAYLDEFLSDPLVVQLPRWFWLPLLRRVILPSRSKRSARAYASVWGPRGAPLLMHGLDLRDALRTRLGARFQVELAMRYGEPSLRAGLRALAELGVERALVAPLFPQRSLTTSGTIEIAAARAQRELGSPLELAFLGSFPSHPGYVSAVAGPLARLRAASGSTHVVLSFHGVPESYVRRGDPYQDECASSARAIAAAAGLREGEWSIAFQSRFGPSAWLQPYTEPLLRQLAQRHRHVLIATPGFACDCLETIEELGERARAAFRAAGGEELHRLACLNADPEWVAALGELLASRAADLEPA